MIREENISISVLSLLLQKLKDYKLLFKLNLSLLVVFSSLIGYVIIPELPVDLAKLALLFIGGILVTMSANACNEIIERKSDAKMTRTASRPLVQNNMTVAEAFILALVFLVLGLYILFHFFNGLAALLSFISFALYVFVYTPLKKYSAISVLVGAIPGSMPCLIGWAAGTGSIMMAEAWVLFAFQFFWQFPHFWAIAWLGHDDYTKAGMKMLPQANKETRFTAFQSVFYAAILIPLAVLPYILGLCSLVASVILVLSALGFVYFAIQFFRFNNDAKARQLMFASFAYLPIILFTFLIDKLV